MPAFSGDLLGERSVFQALENRSFILAGCSVVVLGSMLLAAGSALAAPRDASALSLVEEATADYAAKKWKSAGSKLKRALKQCGKGQCSDPVRARVYRALGAVQIAGFKDAQAGSEDLAYAVQADPEARFEQELATRDVLAAYEAMGGPSGTVKASKASATKEPAKKKPSKRRPAKVEEDEEDEEELDEPGDGEIFLDEEEPATKARDTSGGKASSQKKNFVSLAVQQDLLLLTGDERTCGGDSYRCFDSDKAYTETPYPDGGNGVSGGFALASTRLLVGYDRLLFDQLLAGARVGFAFGGAPEGFLPLHLELRAQYYFAERPFAKNGLRPYAGLGFGLAQVDAKVNVEVYADEQAYLAGDARELEAWRKAGRWFLAPTVGAGYAFASSSSIFVELRTAILFGDGGFAPAVAVGYAHGL